MTEEELHIRVMNYLRHSLPMRHANGEYLYYHTPNGGWRHPAIAAKLKAMGTLAGVPDLIFIRPHNGLQKLDFIELKKDAKQKLSESQEWFRHTAEQMGCNYAVCWSIDMVEKALEAWGFKLRARIGGIK